MYESDEIIAYLEERFVTNAPRKLSIEDHAIRYRTENGTALNRYTYRMETARSTSITRSSTRRYAVKVWRGKLMEACAHELDRTGLKAHPTCSYAEDWFRKHPEWEHLLA